MNCLMVFNDWQRRGRSIYGTDLGLELSAGDLHSGTTWRVAVDLPADIAAEIERAYREHNVCPVFCVFPEGCYGA